MIDILGPVYMEKICSELLVFSVTPLKIDQNKNQNPSIDKVQNQGNERIHMQNPSPRFRQVQFFIYEISGDLYGYAMLVPIRMGTNMAAGNQ